VGITQEECSDFGWGDTLHPDDAGNTIAKWKECARTGEKWDIIHRFKGVDGKWHPILARGIAMRDEHGNITGWAGINLDISELKQTEENLRQSDERHRLLSETMLQGVVHQDSDGRIISMNPAAEQILGKTKERFLGSSSVEEEHDTIFEDGTLFPGEEHPAMITLRSGEALKNVVMDVFNPSMNE
jgi:PAS domain S-box-containing protein